VGTLYNPPFRAGPAGVQLAYHMGGPIIRGFIKRSQIGSAPPAQDPGAQGRCYFMFNPTTLSQGFSYDTTIYNPSQATQADQNIQPYGQAAFNFALFFERTAEVNANPDNAGCLVDLDVLSYIVRGVPANLASPGGLAGATSGDPRVHINGSTSASIIADPTGTFIGAGQTIDAVFSKYMTMRGTVNSLVIDFQKFSHNMIPTMMTVNIGMLLLAQNVGTNNNTGTPNDSTGGTSSTSVVGDPSNRFSRGVVTPT
jgi:hypothetical protein